MYFGILNNNFRYYSNKMDNWNWIVLSSWAKWLDEHASRHETEKGNFKRRLLFLSEGLREKCVFYSQNKNETWDLHPATIVLKKFTCSGKINQKNWVPFRRGGGVFLLVFLSPGILILRRTVPAFSLHFSLWPIGIAVKSLIFRIAWIYHFSRISNWANMIEVRSFNDDIFGNFRI